MVLTPLFGLAVAGLAIAFAEGTGRSSNVVLFSGQSALPNLVLHAAGWTVGALVLLVVCKGVAYGISLSGFRGGPVFPAMFIGAAAGVAASHLPGMSLVPGVAMGIGAMTTVMLKLPLTSTLWPHCCWPATGSTSYPWSSWPWLSPTWPPPGCPRRRPS